MGGATTLPPSPPPESLRLSNWARGTTFIRMVKRKVSLESGEGPKRGSSAREPSQDVLELFFNTGIVFHELGACELPDIVSGFVVMQEGGVRRAAPGEEPDVEVSAVEHVAELSHRWLPVPY